MTSRRCLAASVALIWTACSAFSAVRTWDGGGPNDNLTTAANWTGDTPPASTAPFDEVDFGGTLRTNPVASATVSLGSVEFLPGAASFTLRGSSVVKVGNADLSSGGITNRSALPQRFICPVSQVGGMLLTDGADLIFDGLFNVGDSANTDGRNTIVDGSGRVWLSGGLQGAGGGATQGGLIFKRGRGTLFLTADSPAWNGNVTVYDGMVRVTSPLALGSVAGTTFIDGMVHTGRVEVVNNINVPENFMLIGRSDPGFPVPHLVNVAGTNTLSGSLTFQPGGRLHGIECVAGQLTVAGKLLLGTLTSTRELRLGGAGIGFLSGAIVPGTANVPLVKVGDGTWIINGPGGHNGDTIVLGGRLAVTSAAALSNSPAFEVQAGGVLDFSAIPNGFIIATNRVLRGAGSVLGAVTVRGLVTPGSGLGRLTFSNNLALAGTVVLAINRAAAQSAAQLAAPAMVLGGSLVVTNLGAALEPGDEFRLFATASLSGTFTSVVLPNLAPGNTWDTSRLASDGVVRVMSDPATITPPHISTQPQGAAVECGTGGAVLSVIASGAPPLAYQWRKAGLPIPGATESTFAVPLATLANQGAYEVVVGNAAGAITSSVATLVVTDTRAPILTLAGANPLVVECHGVFTDPGATATDTCSGTLPVSVSGVVDTNTPGSYALTYRATDTAGNTAALTRTVSVRDTLPPVIIWSAGDLVLNAGADCSAILGDLTGPGFILAHDVCGSVTMTQAPPPGATLALGTNKVVLTAVDAAGNVTRQTNAVIVADLTAPRLTLLGANPFRVECHSIFSDPGATATDACSGAVPVTVTGAVNAETPGTYALTYRAVDAAGNAAVISRSVIVEDSLPPAIQLKGAATMTVECPNIFTDPGATAPDACDGARPVTVSGSVNASLPGVYVLTYRASDASGNVSSTARTVTVADGRPPTLTLNGPNPLTLPLGTAFADPGARALDACSGPLPVSVSGSVNVNAAGAYPLIYRATDTAGNAAVATRVVHVLDEAPPTITIQPTSQTVECAGPATLLAAASGTPPLHFQWYRGTLPVTAPGHAALNLPSVTPSLAGDYWLLVTNHSGSATSTVARVTVKDTVPPTLTLAGSSPVSVECHSTFADPGATATDLCGGGLPVAVSGAVDTRTPGTYTLTYRTADPAGNTAVITRKVEVVDTTPPLISFAFRQVEWPADSACGAVMPDLGGPAFITAHDACSGTPAISQSISAGARLALGTNVVVLTAQDAAGNAAFSTNFVVVRDVSPPRIFASPSSVTTNTGAAVAFHVTAQACTPMHYQWLFDGVPLAAGTNATLLLENVQTNLGGQYAARITSDGGSITSAVATLTLLPAFTNSPLPEITGLILRQDGKVELAFRGLPGKSYRVQRTSRLGVTRSWSALGLAVPAASDPAHYTFVDPAAPSTNAFYRIVLQ